MDDAFISLTSVVVVCLLAYWIISSAVRAGTKPQPPKAPSGSSAAWDRAIASHLPRRPPPPARVDGPGRFRVEGVDRETKMDVTAHYEAANEANARVKGELDGIVVTGVERVTT